MTQNKDDLEERVNQFNLGSLPGQPRIMHMGTSYLVNQLWREVQKLRTQAAHTERRVQLMAFFGGGMGFTIGAFVTWLVWLWI